MKFLNFLALSIICIFLISGVSAVAVAGGEWNSGGSYVEIENGQNIDFSAYFGSTKGKFTANVKLYDSSFNVLNVFENNKLISGYSYADSYTITHDMYQNVGSYTVQIICSDTDGSNSYTLYLTVKPIVPPANNPPVITSVPVTQINEGAFYSYKVVAVDPDGDVLTYSLTQNPSWLSINPSTGLITGTAPQVNSDTADFVKVSVSDGVHSVMQTYILTVKNIVQPPEDTTPPVITLLGPNPQVIQKGSPYVEKGATAYDNVDGDLTSSIIINSSNVNTNIIGSYAVTYTVSDSSGNTATKIRVVNVVKCTPPEDTTPPVITVISPESKEYDTKTITFKVLTNEPATVKFSLNGGEEITMDNLYGNTFTYTATLSEGAHVITFFATDSSSNQASKTVAFSIKLTKEQEIKKQMLGLGGVRVIPEDELDKQKYMEQYTPKTIYLSQEYEEEVSGFQKFMRAILNFFRRIFRR